jgi:drug/metabolite transporter (DMT)-like permease
MLWHTVSIDSQLLIILFFTAALSVAGNLFYSFALKHTTAANVAQFHYTQIITGAIIGYLMWQSVPTPFLIVGSVIIIASGLYIATRARKAEILTTIGFV